MITKRFPDISLLWCSTTHYGVLALDVGWDVGLGGHLAGDGVSQRIVDRWDDQIGGLLSPGAINWDRWHASNPKPEMSRLKRDIVERKARKLQLV
ncbi:hypothetical protein NLM31_22845 [Bradyrhizobium sp. CCGUVB4N]|uniref:hypothetical protein n=1 Tax=Bradyrhizobium sp. CCGUVB4N TaxID=2949631 RepID=UPI0020B31BAC|nr:hypothetical protein [Bradyrhizobium sp. CCGUVB4N]MCP3383209.1 hypothetical protein [Bradyrhizobium sp. CCGUVB4N]